MTDNNIDALMDLDPLELTPDDITAIVNYHRRNRANSVDGAKPRKETGPVAKIDLIELGAKPMPAPFKRRF
jgi:hypothetical protein